MPTASRAAAADTLTGLDSSELPLPALFDQIARRRELTAGDRQLAMNIVYGVLRNRDYLDTLISLLASRPTKRLEPFIRLVLRIGLYQLFFLDRVPPSAAVNESVELVKDAGYPRRLQGFVNGVLRQSLRRKATLPTPLDPGADGEPVRNHPPWLTRRWEARHGTETMERICRHHNLEPVLCLRAHPGGTRTELLDLLADSGVTAEPGRYGPDAVLLPGYRGPIEALPGYAQGRFQVQDQAAQLVTLLLGPFANGAWLDGCAGRGGKTGHLAALLAAAGSTLTAIEPDSRRFRLLEATMRRLRTDGVVELHQDTLERFAVGPRSRYDRILVDAPCSGTGVIGRQPDIRWRRREADLHGYRERQLRLLEAAARLLVPGGVLLYVTCSLEPEENEAVVETFLGKIAGFSLTDARPHLPPEAAGLVRDPFFSTVPGPGLDGLFGARLSKHP